MNAIPLCPDDHLGDGVYNLNQKIQTHLKEIIKAHDGAELQVIVLEKGIGTGILGSNQTVIKVDLNGLIYHQLHPIHLIIGACRPLTVKKILEHGTGMGVQKITFVPAELTEKSYLTSQELRPQTIIERCLDGLAQANRYCQLPKISIAPNFLSAIAGCIGVKFLLSPYTPAVNNFLSNQKHILTSSQITLAIGPERGWTAKEEDLLKQNYFQEVFLSHSILRVEYAVLSALAQLELIRGF